MKIKQKYSPYIFLAFLSFTGEVLAYAMVPGFHWYIYVLGFIWRFIFMCGFWQIIRLINKRLERPFAIEDSPLTQIILQVVVALVILSPVFIFSYLIARPYLPAIFLDSRILPMILMAYFLFILMIIFAYYAHELFSKYKNSFEERSRLQLEAAQREKELELAAAQREKERSLLRYHHLKNQVNPHFLFNTLSSLEALIQTDPNLASEFVRHLAIVYRYVLEHKENEVVGVETELDFIRHYVSLLQIRYNEAIHIKFEISPEGMEREMVMVTLQMLIDNAIKHNSMQTDKPLEIRIWDEDDYLHVQNNKQVRRQIAGSNRQGLRQLQELYSFLTDRPVEINDHADSFEVNLPLL